MTSGSPGGADSPFGWALGGKMEALLLASAPRTRPDQSLPPPRLSPQGKEDEDKSFDMPPSWVEQIEISPEGSLRGSLFPSLPRTGSGESTEAAWAPHFHPSCLLSHPGLSRDSGPPPSCLAHSALWTRAWHCSGVREGAQLTCPG